METLIKRREIFFDAMHPDKNQAQSAMLLLADIEGIEEVLHLSPLRLVVSYDVRHLTLALLESSLANEGFHLDNSLMAKLRRALYTYTEDTQRANLGVENGENTRNIFVNRYERLPHGCRDERPDHWRHYR